MRVPLSLLADHVDVDVPAATLAEKLTFREARDPRRLLRLPEDRRRADVLAPLTL